MVNFERVAQLCYHAILEVRGGITHPHTRHPHSLAPIEQVLSRNLGGGSLGWLNEQPLRGGGTPWSKMRITPPTTKIYLIVYPCA